MVVHGRHLRRPYNTIRHEERFFRPCRPFEPHGPEEVPLLLARRIARQTKGLSLHERFSSNRRYSEHDETLYEETTYGYGKIEILLYT